MFFSGLLPLFVIAHFGHHVVGALLNPLMPMIRNELGLSYTEAGVVISAFAVTNGISQLPSGWLADRFGARLMVVISVSGVAVAGLLIGLSTSYLTLIAFLVLTAILGGGYHPASTSAISTIVSPERRGRALGLHLIGGSSTFWVIPLVAAPIAATFGWRGPYVILTIPVIVLGIVLYYLIGRRTRIALSKPELLSQRIPPTPGRIQWRVLLPFLVLSVGTGMIIQSIGAYYSLFAVDQLKVPEATAAALMAITPAVGALAAPFGGYLSDRFGGVRVIIVASLLAAPLLYALSLVSNVTSFVAVLLFIGGVTMTRMPTSEAFIVGNIPENRRSTILGIYFFAGAEMAGLMTPLVGHLIDRLGFGTVFTVAAASQAIVAAICSVFLWRTRTSVAHSTSD